MLPLSDLDVSSVEVVVFDSDGVTIKQGTELIETENMLKVKTNVISDEMVRRINELKKYCTIVVSSGRGMMHLQKAYFKVIDENVILQAENGIFTLKDGELKQNYKFNNKDMRNIRDIKKRIKEIDDKNIKGFEPKVFLITVHCMDRVLEIERLIEQYDDFYYIWNGEAYDISKKGIDKGFGLNQFKGNKIIAVGNGVNDEPMTDRADIGVTTDKGNLKADYYTDSELENGGLEVINHLIEGFEV